MSGIEIIEWAVRRCQQEKVPPTDNAIVRMIRYHLIDVNDVQRRPAEARAAIQPQQEGEG